MRLKKLKFAEFLGTDRAWDLDWVVFKKANLIVGQNASGKTRILNVISGVASLFNGRRPNLYDDGNYELIFEDGAVEYHYTLIIREFRVEIEKLTVDGKTVLDRRPGGAGEIWAEKANQFLEFQSPSNLLVLTSRQDDLQHPFLSKIVEWASHVLHFQFGTDLGRSHLGIQIAGAPPVDIRDTGNVLPILIKGIKDFGGSFEQAILNDLHEVGYAATAIGYRSPPNIVAPGNFGGQFQNIFLVETGMLGPTDQVSMSQGMFRALSLIIQMNFAEFSSFYSTLLIDDIGEGLDFERSRALIKLVMERIPRIGSDLIMTTNDRFVMNTVPLENWTVLNRQGHSVQVMNIENSREKFEEFAFTGLSNFDFFASEYLTSREEG